ncbi:fimbria/pilus outer membrane usher protein [Serratia sp. UGAL515B_01]|uniref:fimbria/pilus outer membrane usher protein n=1 Tax=Serratia sp. UGAL515B_01 TaxID=2986763 RepID=UPI0029530725|nr:fimbria/pilus outer membrane usher protein [Serratia sp. UGAL515B_01]WON76402.1 fimbria/pilus outer membrane usher protein [Serratia sp. UGAL515B_01]
MDNKQLVVLTVAMLFLIQGNCKDYDFDVSALGESYKDVDLSLLSEGGQLPGIYTVDILVNGEKRDTREMYFKQARGNDNQVSLQPCISTKLLSSYRIKTDDYPDLNHSTGQGEADSACADLSAIPNANATFDFNNQQLYLSIPQIALYSESHGLAPVEQWDDGIPALLLNYRANTNRVELHNLGQSNTSSYLQLNPGINIGSWRLRNQVNWQRLSNGSSQWQNLYTYAERGFYKSKNKLTLGDKTTPDNIFDSLPFRGVMLGSDDSMVPADQRDYGPVIQGIARTLARVEVRQNGFVIYNATVAPGPFSLTDINSYDFGGNLQVTVWETDGKPQVFSVPYQKPAIALRQGYLKYNVMLGRYRSSQAAEAKEKIVQATMMYGLPWDLTAYGGGQFAQGYAALASGLGMSLGLMGALSIDVMQTRAEVSDRNRETGRIWRLRYNKMILSSNTSLSASYNTYTNKGVASFNEFMNQKNNLLNIAGKTKAKKSMTALTLSQPLSKYGYFNFSMLKNNYYNAAHDSSISAGYSFNFFRANVSLNFSLNKSIRENNITQTDKLSSLWVSIPLGNWLKTPANMTLQTSLSDNRRSTILGLNGQAVDHQLYWDMRQSVTQNRESKSTNTDRSLFMTWYGGYGQVSGNYQYSAEMRQAGAEIDGSLIAHRHGFTFGQPLGETVALIEAPGATNVPVGNWPGIKTDFRGYAAVSYLNPYQDNILTLNPAFLSDETEVLVSDVSVVPTEGAIVSAKFVTRTGGRGLIQLKQTNGAVVPFGALAQLESEIVTSSIVGEDGQLYISGLSAKGILNVRWAKESCKAEYVLPEKKNEAGLYVISALCRS